MIGADPDDPKTWRAAFPILEREVNGLTHSLLWDTARPAVSPFIDPQVRGGR